MGTMRVNPSQVEVNNSVTASPANNKSINIELSGKPTLSNVPQDELYLIGNNNSQIVQNEEDMSTVKIDSYLDNKNIETTAKGDYNDAYELSHSEVESSVVKTSERNPYVLSVKDSKAEQSTYPGMKGVKEALPYSLEKNSDDLSLELKAKDYMWGKVPSLPYVPVKKENPEDSSLDGKIVPIKEDNIGDFEKLPLDAQITSTNLIPDAYFESKSNDATTRQFFRFGGDVLAGAGAVAITATNPVAGYVAAPLAIAYGDDLGDLAYDGLKNAFSGDSDKVTQEYIFKMKDVFQARFGDKWEHINMLSTLKAYPKGATRIALYEAYNERPRAPASRTESELADLQKATTSSGETVYLPSGQTEAKITAQLDFFKGGGYVYAGFYPSKEITKKIKGFEGINQKVKKFDTVNQESYGGKYQTAVTMLENGMIPGLDLKKRDISHLKNIVNNLPIEGQLEVMYEFGGTPMLLVSPNPEQIRAMLSTGDFGASLRREMKKFPGLYQGFDDSDTKDYTKYSGSDLSKKFRIAIPISKDFLNFSVGVIFDEPRDHIKHTNKGIGSHWFSVFTKSGDVGDHPSFTMKMGVDARTGSFEEKTRKPKLSEVNTKKEIFKEGMRYIGSSALNMSSNEVIKRNGFVEVGVTIAGNLNPNNFVYDENGVKRYTCDSDIGDNLFKLFNDPNDGDFYLLPENFTPALGELFVAGARKLAKPFAQKK